MNITKERVETVITEERTRPTITEERVGSEAAGDRPGPPEHTAVRTPDHGHRGGRKLALGLAGLVVATGAVVFVTTRDDGTEPEARALPVIPADEWVLPETVIPRRVLPTIPADRWTPPETSVAEGAARAALSHWTLPETSIAEARAEAALANWTLPETSVADGMDAAAAGSR